MNRSSRAKEFQMQASVNQRQQMANLRTSMVMEKDEELALFLEMRKREKESNNLLLHHSEDFEDPVDLKTMSKRGDSELYLCDFGDVCYGCQEDVCKCMQLQLPGNNLL